jgi:hypothetical protein
MNHKRKLKVYYGYTGRKYRKVPVIRLAGVYLSKAGFKIGDIIHINFEAGEIHISIDSPSEADLGSAGAQPDRNNLD